MMITCPVCGWRSVGKVGADQYYCWDCCVEFSLGKRGCTVFNVELDGSLTSAAPISETIQENVALQYES